ncbi:nuclear transport factor 2 family protein [Chitinasiproducens palmae]|uniref:SnoaL-like domain-containing protein n=1 Tax=Chitinasiproducens palmae TaxID=1770053 RepID=A0A1H2PQB0_9BURK|nr:nuclear transport factor 2 family protein [Chitinasiproducens palmae]SDV49004.1 hypothetical protein SAMN05216551_106248 [Chitinasiproducens palmae]
MQAADPLAVVQRFFRRAGTAQDVSEIAELVSEDVDWFVAGDLETVPWIGRKAGRAGAAQFYAQIREQLISERFEITTFVAQGERVLALGELASRVRRTGKLIESEFAFDFVVKNGLITRFRLFEDSFAVAAACA